MVVSIGAMEIGQKPVRSGPHSRHYLRMKWMNDVASHAKYWLPEESILATASSEDLLKAFKLSAFKRSIGNFVHIIVAGNTNIKVAFNDGVVSSTDGKTVIIGAPTKTTSTDVIIGMALHEAAHCAYSPIKSWNRLRNKAAKYNNLYRDTLFSPLVSSTMCRGDNEAFNVMMTFNLIVNIIEDMRIDRIVYSESPGYRPYYQALYNQYVYNKSNDHALATSAYRSPTIDNYLRMLMSIGNNNLNPLDLPRFQDILDIIDLPNLNKLSLYPLGWIHTTSYKLDGFETSKPLWMNVDPIWTMAMKVLEIIITETDGDFSESVVRKLYESSTTVLNKHFRTRVEFISGVTNKKSPSEKMLKLLDSIDELDLKITDVGEEGDILPRKIPVITSTGGFPFIGSRRANLSRGMQMGRQLAEQLQFRADPIAASYQRQSHGKIDKTMLHLLGTDNFNVFTKTRTDYFRPVVVYLTIDASSSMDGIKWSAATRLMVSMAVLADTNPTLDLVITLRGTTRPPNGLPILSVIHDSRKNSFSESQHIFSNIVPSGYTPESLCFEAQLESIINEEKTSDVYFINVSDGCPQYECFINGSRFDYSGAMAIQHTRSMVTKLKNSGVIVMSYFVSDLKTNDSSRSITSNIFKKMYGDTAEFIDVDSTSQILRTLKKMLSKREDMEHSYS